MGALDLISLATTLVGTLLVNRGVIGQSTDNLVTGLFAQLTSFVNAIKAKTAPQDPYLALLATAAGVIAVLEANTALPTDVLSTISALDKDVQAAIQAYVTAGKGFDATVYAPIAEV